MLFTGFVFLTHCLIAARGYETVYPFKADSNDKRELSTNVDGKHQDEVSIVITREDKDMVLELKRNVGFHADNVLLRTFDDNGNAITEKHTPESCYYSGNVADVENSYVLLDSCDGLRGTIEINGKMYSIEPKEDVKDGAHKFYEVENNDGNLAKRALGMNPFSDDYVDLSDQNEVTFMSENAEDEPTQIGLVPDVDPVYAKYPITNKTRYCEMFLVVENAIFVKYNRSKQLVLSRMMNMIHAVDRSYAAANIRLVLVALEIWTDANKIPYVTSGGGQLGLFNTYRRNNLLGVVRHDIAHYMSSRSWSGGVIGMAYVGGICQNGHGTAVNLWSFTSITGTSEVVAHELGHNFGFPHDGDSCVCLTSRGCFMGGPKSRRPGFSDCNMKVLSDPKRAFQCLNNYPRNTLDNVCGNGLIEGSEECDCGSVEMCKRLDSCCQPHNCKLKRSAQCSDFNTPDCCKNCLFKKQGTLCREAQNNCDLPEYCPGNSGSCPSDVYMKDGTACSSKVSVITANLGRSEKTIKFDPKFIARYLRFNPIYWPKSWACMRMEMLTCTANEDDVINVPQPISTPGLYYTSSLCFVPKSIDCDDSKANDSALIFKREQFGDCNKPNYLFVLENDGTLRHQCSGKIVCPDSSNYLSLKKECPNDRGKYQRLANFGLKHLVTGDCVEATDGWPMNNKMTKLRSTKNCAGSDSRTKLHFLETDCMLPIGMENGKLPDSAFTASRFHSPNPPKEARLNTGKSWCAPQDAGKNEYLQVDLGAVKTIGRMRVAGTYWNWVSGFKLFYSDDGKNWKGYYSNGDLDKNSSSYCYSGSCGKSRNLLCKDLWDAGTKSADTTCWNKLNVEANGFGTCDPTKNKSCAQENIFCGQIQCFSSKDSPSHVKYGSVYRNILLNGTKCSAASITIPGSSSDQIGNGMGMVADGTKCGDGKMCSDYKCKSISELNITDCQRVNGSECAGQGICDNKGKCHCTGGYDPETNCATVLKAIDGNWAQWTDWTECSAACNGGMRKRSRFCDSPFPAHGGNSCPGVGYEEEQCNTESCPKAKSCKLLKQKFELLEKPMIDGVYEIELHDGKQMKVYCDMTRDGGGWTLVVTAAENNWTTSEMVRERNKDSPSLFKDYSILKYVDKIKDNYDIDGDHFEYRLEAHRRGRWGGIWSAPIHYKFDSFSSSQTDVKLMKKFDDWTTGSKSIANRMPHIIKNWLTTQTRINGWGSITGNNKNYHPAPWISGELKESKPEYIWYWLREGKYKFPFSCTEIRLRALARGHKPKTGLYEIRDPDNKKLSTICDMQSFGGGWTLVLNKVSSKGWTKATTLSRNVDKASITKDYSILHNARGIAALKQQEETTFQYMLEADGDKMWGGVFEARIEDVLHECNVNTKKPNILKKFSNWNESNCNLAKRVPYILDNPSSYLTTELSASNGEDGVLVSATPSIYIKGSKEVPSFIRMWIRESASQKSCNQIKVRGQRKGALYKNGFYTAYKSGADIRTIFCDMTSDSGAWTLLVTSAHGNWSKNEVLSRNEEAPSISNDYSILGIADEIKKISNNATFKYKLDASKFNHWGGIWEAPIQYTFLPRTNRQDGVKLLKQFDEWKYNVWHSSVNNRMPWLGQKKGILTTSSSSDYAWWGTIIADNNEYQPAPWISGSMSNPGVIWYWINEDDCDSDRKAVDGGMNEWSAWTPCSVNCGRGVTTRFRTCTQPKPRCGGAPCDSGLKTNEQKECTGKCQASPIKSYNSQYCILPKTGQCSPADGTDLVWKSGIDKCDLPEAQFIVDFASGLIVHKCSGKTICPQKGATAYKTRIVVDSTCPEMKPKRRFTRTIYNSLHFGDKCIHSYGSWPGNDVRLVLWAGCDAERYKMLLYKTASGPVHTKRWNNVKIVKSSITDLTSDVRFPNNPTSSGFLDNFDAPYGMGNNYGNLLWSYFLAPETGFYTFYSACDDYCQIFLSTTDAEADKKKIIDQKGWSNQYQYDRRSDQKSDKIPLIKGKLYYLEAVHFEMSGGDHISVGVTLPSGKELKPIIGYYLRSRG